MTSRLLAEHNREVQYPEECIYNFDKTGFLMDAISAAMIITGYEQHVKASNNNNNNKRHRDLGRDIVIQNINKPIRRFRTYHHCREASPLLSVWKQSIAHEIYYHDKREKKI